MKLTIVLLTVAFLNVSATGLSQNISFDGKNVPLEKVLFSAKEQSGYNFFYNISHIRSVPLVSLHVKNMPLQQFLAEIFKDLPLDYSIENKNIIISRKTTGTTQPKPDFERLSLLLLPQSVTGKVLDAQGNPIMGATILNRNSKKSTTSASGGSFTLSADEGDVLSISHVSFETIEYKITGAILENQKASPASGITIALKAKVSDLDEVVVAISTGYQHIAKERATGSFTQPDKKMFTARVSPDVMSRLEGITSGLVFNRGTLLDNEGKKPDVSIRGRSTIFANDQPLIVVDNFPYEGDIRNINPNDVASVTVLKDAAAASIWGVQAGNGVIVITTHKGKSGRGLTINFNANTTTSEKPDLYYDPKYLSSSDYIDIETFLFNNGKYDGPLGDITNHPAISPAVQILNKKKLNLLTEQEANDQLNALRQNDVRAEQLKYFYRNPSSQQYSLSMSGGSDKVNYYFSSGFDKSLSNQRGNDNNRITINSQATFKPVKNLEFTAGMYYIKAASTGDNTLTGVKGSTSYNPYLKLADAQGNPLVMEKDISAAYRDQAISNGFLDWSYIPLNELGANPGKSKTNDMRLTGGLKYTLLPGISAEVKYQYQQVIDKSRLVKGEQSYDVRSMINRYSKLTNDKVTGYNVPLGGILYLSDANMSSNNVRGQLNFDRSWNRHAVTSIIGYEIGEVLRESSGQTVYGYNDELGTSKTVDGVTAFDLNPSGSGTIPTNGGVIGRTDRIRSSFFNAAYTYNQLYTFSASARIDGSNYFGVKTNQKNVPLWSTGLRWNISNETFYKSDWFPYLSARLSYGYNGNLDKSATGVITFMYSSIGATWTNLPNACIVNIGNPELRWEKIGITNLGIDFGMRNQVLTGTIEYYWKKGVDILGDKPFAPSTGASNLRGNYSNMKANGLDVTLTSKNIDRQVKWTSSLLFSTTRDKVTVYDVVDPYTSSYVGFYNFYPVINRPVHGIYSYKWAGLDPLTGDPQGYVKGQISTDHAAIINNTEIEELIYNGPARPTIFGGLNNAIAYKNFTLSANISYKLGYYFRRSTVNYNSMYNNGITGAMHQDYTKRWQKPGDEAHTTIPAMGAYPGSGFRDQFYAATSATVEKGDHIRLQDISLSYTLDRSIWKNIPVNNIQFYVYANNLGILWKANDAGLDPDSFTYPNPRSISFGIKASL